MSLNIREFLKNLIDKLSDEELYELYILYKLSRENAGFVYEYYARHRRGKLGRFTPMIGEMPSVIKEYRNVEVIKLPEPIFRRLVYVEDALVSRRSVRHFLPEPLTLEELSTLLYLSFGISAWVSAYGFRKFPLRTFPSAGALQPIEVYVIVHGVLKLKPGIYHYQPINHSLEKLKEGNYIREIIDIALGQEHVGNCPVTLVLTIYWARTRWKYGDRAYRYALLDAGFAGENVYLACEALGLGTCAIGAFYDEELCKLLEIDCKDEIPVLMFPIGKPVSKELR